MPPPLRAAAALAIGCRAETDEDGPFLEALYASTRSGELAMTGWPEVQQRAFLTQQYQAQHAYYRTQYPDAEWLILERDGEPIGRLYLADGPTALRIIDVSLVPLARGQGTGAAIVADLIEAAAAAQKRVSLQVEKHNPARRLYERLGFAARADHGIYVELECRPDGAA
jgi:GNAT superfamily N-acetyltransferase